MATVDPYCTDEDICLRAVDDFVRVAPDNNKLAAGNDGVLDFLDPWVLESASNDFESLGVKAGHIVHLRHAQTKVFGPNGDLFAIESVSGTSATLRRVGFAAGVGKPPCPAGGISGVEFVVRTLDPQIEDISYEINEKYAILGYLPDREVSDLTDVRQLRALCVESTLARRFLDMSEKPDGSDMYVMKSRYYAEKAAETERLIQLRWGPSGDADPPTGRYFGRCARG